MIAKRIEMLRSRLGMTQDSFGKTVGCTAMRICRLEKGEVEPSEKELQAICDRFCVCPEWLRWNYESPMFEVGIILLNDKESVSRRLIALRKEKKCSQRKLAEGIGAEHSTISNVETRKTDLTEDLANRIAAYFNVGTRWLMYGDEKYRDYPVNRAMIDWLWEHREVREQLYCQMNGEDIKRK